MTAHIDLLRGRISAAAPHVAVNEAVEQAPRTSLADLERDVGQICPKL
jgi:hypothetical protein